MKSFPSFPKRKLFWTFSFHFLSFNGVFLTLKWRTLFLKPPHGDLAAVILLKMDTAFIKVFKNGKSEYSRAFNASYTFQSLVSFWWNWIRSMKFETVQIQFLSDVFGLYMQRFCYHGNVTQRLLLSIHSPQWTVTHWIVGPRTTRIRADKSWAVKRASASHSMCDAE